MPSRQAIWQKEHRAAGLCVRDSNPAWRGGICFPCAVSIHFSKRGILKIARSRPRSWRKFLAGLQARYTRILEVEGFAIDALMGPEEVIKAADMKWAKYKLKKKVLEVINAFDDKAIRERFRGAD